jgi:putative ABC transport system substrate-binding protein
MDVIVAAPAPPAAAAKNATGTIPIVMIGVSDPVGQGLIASLARPGGNVTGLSYGVDHAIFGKQLALLKEIVPSVRRVAVLWNPAVPSLAPAITEVKAAARSLGLELQLLEARGPDKFDGAFAAMVKERAGALLVLTDSVFSAHSKRLADLAAKSRLPAAYTNRLPVEAGRPHCLQAELP